LTLRKLLPRKWQDAVFFVGELVFAPSLIPIVAGPEKPPALTSIATATMLYAFMACHASYRLWFTFTMTAVTASLWLTAGLQVALG
jgi:hypothetical protein